MSQAEAAKPGPLPIIGGLLLVALSVSLAGVAWVGYDRGVPGLPQMPPEQQGGIVLYAPPDVEFDTRVFFYQKGSVLLSSKGPLTADSILIEITFKTTHQSPFVIVAGFRGDARITQGIFSGAQEFDVDQATIGRYNNQHFWPLAEQVGEGPLAPGPHTIRYTYRVANQGTKAGGYMFVAGGAFVHPVFNSDNARTAIQTKRVYQVARCTALSDPAVATSFSRERWLDAGLPTCRWHSGATESDFTEADKEHNRNQRTTIYIKPNFSSPRLDFANSPVAPNEVLGWESPPIDWPFFRVTASLTDLDQEARAQSYLFASGVAVGLATSLFPASMKVIFDQLNQRRRWRRQRRQRAPSAR